MPEIGKRISHYRIIEKIGAGGMGEVYRARDVRLEREVAIKVLPPHLTEDAAALARFEREAKAIAALSHPNILGIFDFGSEGGIAYAVTELLDGETLRAQLADGALPVRKAVDYAAQMAQGLAAAHDKGITHRDLKPENVFVAADGRVKILDFGLAKQGRPEAPTSAIDSPTMGTLTDPGIVMGTIAYMAPEQARGQAVDPQADIFSLGTVLYEMLAGRPAFRRETATDTMVAILKEDPPELAAVDAKIPAALARLVQHCLEKNPAARYQSARDVAFALEALAGSASTISGPTMVAAAPERRWIRWLAAAVIALSLLAAGIFAGRRLTSPAAPGEVTFEQKTFDPQFISNARFLPEGKGIVFSAALEGNLPELFVIHAGAALPEPLHQPRTHLLSVSKNGELAVLTDVSYLGQRLYRGTLAVMPLDGAPKARMTDVREADWSPDGSDLALIRQVGTADQLEYPPDRVVYKSTGYLSDLRVSPDGNQVAFFEHPSRGWDDRGDVKVVDRASGAVKQMAGVYFSLEGLAWMPGGEEVVFSASKMGPTNHKPYLVAVSGREPAHQALPAIGPVYIQDIADDGRWIITRYDVRNFVGFRLPGDKSDQEISWLNSTQLPYLSSTGHSVLFCDQSAGAGLNYAVFYRSLDSAKPIRLGEGAGFGFSPDGKWVLALVNSPPQLVAYPIGPEKTIHLDRGPIERYQGGSQWFPDSKRILFCGNEPSKPTRCYRQDISGGLPVPITPYGFAPALLAPDGVTLLVLGAEGAGQIMSTEGGSSQAAHGLTKDDFPIKWASDNRSVFVQAGNVVPARIEKVDLLSGKRTPVGGEIAPADRAGLVYIGISDIIQDGSGYAYGASRSASSLFVVHFAKQP
jgi:Tol biopolymer transport system component